HDLVAVFLDPDIGIGRAGDRTQGAFDRDLPGSNIDVHPFWQGDGIFGDARHGQATMQRISPPTPSARALRSVITPREVDRLATPRPFMTLGMSSRPLYTRRPGLEMRSSRSITGLPA